MVSLCGAALLVVPWRSNAEGREALARRVSARTKGVPAVTTEELARWIESGRRVVLLDVRSREEFEVSHLEGAEWAEDEARQRVLISAASPEEDVVAYCSVGWRSAVAVERLAPTTAHRVYNLEGSLFRWANEGRPMTDGRRPTTVAHPFDRAWGQLLDCARWPANWRSADGGCR